jgi:YggT family protein
MVLDIVGLIGTLLYGYSLIIIARAILSWFPNLDYSNPIVRFLHQITEPVLRPIRQAMPAMGGMDLSPLVVIIGIQVLLRVLYAAF